MEPPKAVPSSSKPKTVVAKSSAVAATKARPVCQWTTLQPGALLILALDNASPYSSGLSGASLTSTSIEPHTASTPALFDEEELMFDAIQNPVKARREKDVGKVRAYVRVITSLGGSLNLELYCEKVSPFSLHSHSSLTLLRLPKPAIISSC
jgi:peptidyl-prolyl cis-trans isomerase-like protein 2